MTASLFRPSSETAKHAPAKVLLYGPSGSGKTHFLMGAPGLALLDTETRARSFAMRTSEFAGFLHAELPELSDFAAAIKEIRGHRIACQSVGIDSGSAVYLKLVEEHTRQTDRGGYVTDWVTVNRRFLAALNFMFSLVDKNVLVSMHIGVKLVRQGNDFRAVGEQLIGDERIRFGFDYVMRIEPQGDPAVVPALFHIEKTSSPHLRVGAAIPGLSWEKFRALSSGAKAPLAEHPLAQPSPPAAPPTEPAAPAAALEPITHDQHVRIVELAASQHISNGDLASFVTAVTRRTPLLGSTTSEEAARIIRALERRATERATA